MTVPAAAAMSALPVASPPVNDTRSTRGSSESGGAGGRAGAEHEVADAGGQPGLLEQLHQVDRRVRGELARLEHERVAGGQAGRDLPGDLEERVVPRSDQGADADGLVHDPADHVGVAGVDDPAGVLGGDPAVVAEDATRCRRCRTRDSTRRLPVSSDSIRARSALSRSSRSATLVSRSPRSRARRVRPGAVVEGAVRGGDGGLGVLDAGLVHLGDEGPVGRAADLAASSGAGGNPLPIDVEVRARSARSLRDLLRITQPSASTATRLCP